MPGSRTPSVYEQVVQVTQVYLGPAAERFISRQIENHLNKSPASLGPKDILSLIDWIKAAVCLITEDNDIIDEYINELLKVAKKNGA